MTSAFMTATLAALGGAVANGTPESIAEAADGLMAWLTCDERGVLLMVAARAAEPEDLEALAIDVVEKTRRGAPVPVFDDVRSEAALWASWPSLAERRA